MTLKEIATRIDAHLKRFEADPKINKEGEGTSGYRPYRRAGAWYAGGGWINVMYEPYQLIRSLRRIDAVCYLAWLNRGNIGTHRQALREGK